MATPLLERIRGFPWQRSAQPEWNRETAVADALVEVSQVSNVESSSAAQHKLLYAVGNDHAGTYYPVLLAVTPFLEELVRVGEPWAQRTARCTLDDLFASFHPEPGYEMARDSDENELDLEKAFIQSICQPRPLLERMSLSDEFNVRFAEGLLEPVNEIEA